MKLFNFEEEKRKEFNALGLKNMRRTLRELKQRGRSNIARDMKRTALRPGKRISRTGKVYWETRKNRSDAGGGKI